MTNYMPFHREEVHQNGVKTRDYRNNKKNRIEESKENEVARLYLDTDFTLREISKAVGCAVSTTMRVLGRRQLRGKRKVLRQLIEEGKSNEGISG